MKAELKAKWIEALRSGNYPQGKHNLFSKGKYCCLGVLCEVVGMKRKDTAASYGVFTHHGFCMTSEISPQVASEIGISLVEQGMLIGKNDCAGLSFPEIADFIEANIPSE